MAEDARPEQGASPGEIRSLGDARASLILRRGQLRAILARVRNRIHDDLSRVEQEILVDTMLSSIFESQRAYVDDRLREVAPAAFDQLASAQERRAVGDAEARSHALMSCRRALKSVADALYPPRTEPQVGVDGIERELSDQKFLNRLVASVAAAGGRHTTTDLLLEQITELGGKLNRLNDLASKGVHDGVSEFEVDQVIVQTYLTIGDILRSSDSRVPS